MAVDYQTPEMDLAEPFVDADDNGTWTVNNALVESFETRFGQRTKCGAVPAAFGIPTPKSGVKPVYFGLGLIMRITAKLMCNAKRRAAVLPNATRRVL